MRQFGGRELILKARREPANALPGVNNDFDMQNKLRFSFLNLSLNPQLFSDTQWFRRNYRDVEFLGSICHNCRQKDGISDSIFLLFYTKRSPFKEKVHTFFIATKQCQDIYKCTQSVVVSPVCFLQCQVDFTCPFTYCFSQWVHIFKAAYLVLKS